MIKLNRIGNKLGLAGAVGVLLAIGMVANQMVTESANRGMPASAPPDRSRWPITRSPRISTCARFSLPPATSGWRELAPKSKRPSPICSATRRAQAKELEAALETAQRPEAKERLQKTKALMEGFTAAVEDLAKAQITLLAQIDKRSAVSDEWTKAVAAQLGSPAMAKLDNRLEIERLLFQADGKGERAAGGCLEARRHRRCQFGHRDGQDRGLAEGCLQQAARRSRRPRVAGRGQQPVFDRQALPGRQRGGRKDRAGRRTTSSSTAPSRPPPMSPI